ncbi:MAG: DUF6537 domain-containing protein [Myxococcota bacterium]
MASRPGRFRREAVTSRSVAAHGYKLMAYKDEYEVARLCIRTLSLKNESLQSSKAIYARS